MMSTMLLCQPPSIGQSKAARSVSSPPVEPSTLFTSLSQLFPWSAHPHPPPHDCRASTCASLTFTSLNNAVKEISQSSTADNVHQTLLTHALTLSHASLGIVAVQDVDTKEWRVLAERGRKEWWQSTQQAAKRQQPPVPRPPSLRKTPSEPATNQPSGGSEMPPPDTVKYLQRKTSTRQQQQQHNYHHNDHEHWVMQTDRTARYKLPISLFEMAVTEDCLIHASGEELTHGDSSIIATDAYYTHMFNNGRVVSGQLTPRSVICMPYGMSDDGTTTNQPHILYLENCFSTQAFSEERMDACRTLCTIGTSTLSRCTLRDDLTQCESSKAKVLEAQNELAAQRISTSDAIKHAEQAKEQAEAAARTKANFLSNMSHELRTPLNSIIGVVRLLSSTELSSEQLQYVEMLNASGQLLLSIISDVLDFSKIEMDKMVLERRDFALLECIETSTAMVFDMACSKQVDLNYSFGANVPRYVCGDSTRLQQIILNLLSNAIKFGRRGYVHVNIDLASTEDLPVQRSASDSEKLYLKFEVEDDGIGIPADRLDKLFTLFTQAETNTSRRFGGTGLGLAISKKLAEAMGGYMKVTSEIDVGSKFIFVVAFARANVQPLPPAPELDGHLAAPTSEQDSRRSLSGVSSVSSDLNALSSQVTVHHMPSSIERVLKDKRILLISDGKASCRALESMLAPHSCQVTTVSDTTSAITALKLDHTLLRQRSRSITFERDSSSPSNQFDFHTDLPVVSSTADMQAVLPQYRSRSTTPYASTQPSTPHAARSRSTQPTDDNTFDLIVHVSHYKDTSPQSVLGTLMRRLVLTGRPYTILLVHIGRKALLPNSFMAETDEVATAQAVATLPASPSLWCSRKEQLQLVEVTQPIKMRQLVKTMAYLLDAQHTTFTLDPEAGASAASDTEAAPESDVGSRGPLHRAMLRSMSHDVHSDTESTATDDSTSAVAGSPTATTPVARPIARHVADISSQHPASIRIPGSPEMATSSRPPSRSSRQGSVDLKQPMSPQQASPRTTYRNIKAVTAARSGLGMPTQSATASSRTSETTSRLIKNMAAEMPLKLLVAEDNQVSSKMLVMLLKKLGYTDVKTCFDGEEVLTALHHGTGQCVEYDAILMDNSMPVLSGKECAAKIRHHEQTCDDHCHNYIIAQTANVTAEFRAECAEVGMEGFITKPIQLPQLEECLRQAYQQKVRRQQHASAEQGT